MIARNFELEEPNVFRIEGNPSGANGAPVSIRCPHCRQLGSFNMMGHGVTYSKVTTTKSVVQMQAYLRVCPNAKCKGLVATIEDHDGVLRVEPPELLDFDPDGLPRRCEATLKEAVACHGAGAYRAAVMMVRRLLEEVCEENGSTGNTLHERLKSLRSKVVLPDVLFDAMDELKILGNDAAHVEARAYDNIGHDEAEVAIGLVKEIVKALYQLQGLLGRLKNKKALGATA